MGDLFCRMAFIRVIYFMQLDHNKGSVIWSSLDKQVTEIKDSFVLCCRETEVSMLIQLAIIHPV